MKVRKSSDHAHGPPNATVEWTRSEPTRLVRLISFVLRHKSRRRRGDVQERPNVYANTDFRKTYNEPIHRKLLRTNIERRPANEIATRKHPAK
ncbi:MAG: hypothetical protein L6R41_001839 [Letrouitia leprolyta]|nr:MAG: hypothetical protein L6R41_001839 [Letrouitia leprolyta]